MTPTTHRTRGLSLTVAAAGVILSLVTSAGGSWLTLQIQSATTRARLDATDKRIENVAVDIKTLVPKEHFAAVLSDLKEQMVEMRGDLKEIRRAVTVPR